MRPRREFVVAALLALSVSVFAAGADDEYARKRAELDRTQASECFALGQWCLEQELLNEAREQFERALILQPDHAEAKQKLAELGARRTTGVACQLRLVGGEHVKAEFLMASLAIRTDAGLLVIPVAAIDLIRVGRGGKPDRIVSDSFTGVGLIDAESFPARTRVSLVQVARRDLESVRLFRPCPDCGGKTGKCARCKGTGQINERCPKCKGEGAFNCEKCKGSGAVVCPECKGARHYQDMGFEIPCPTCKGSGRIDCPDCRKGMVQCKECGGKGRIAGVCPDCKGARVVSCKACGGTGVKPLPEGETDGEAKPAAPPEEAGPKPDA